MLSSVVKYENMIMWIISSSRCYLRKVLKKTWYHLTQYWSFQTSGSSSSWLYRRRNDENSASTWGKTWSLLCLLLQRRTVFCRGQWTAHSAAIRGSPHWILRFLASRISASSTLWWVLFEAPTFQVVLARIGQIPQEFRGCYRKLIFQRRPQLLRPQDRRGFCGEILVLTGKQRKRLPSREGQKATVEHSS